MRFLSAICTLTAGAYAMSIPRAEPMQPRSRNTTNVVPAQYDGKCFYPVPTKDFELEKYTGKWYQVAGTPFRETLGARCVTAQYFLNPGGTVKVVNGGLVGNRSISAIGTATPAPKSYGVGAFTVEFPSGYPASCPGPNYIVQDYNPEIFSIVQTQEWGTLYILSRRQHPEEQEVEKWIRRAVELGSNGTALIRYSQEDCNK